VEFSVFINIIMSDNVFRGLGVEVHLPATPGIADPKLKYSDSFHVVKETLTRIGISSKKNKTIYQSCHILHKQGHYAILSFKELFLLDGKKADLTDVDIGRRNTIVGLLEEWKLVEVIEKEKVSAPTVPISQIRIIPFKDKANWTLTPKYSIGKK